jgi:epoxyqueuosine reductase
LFAWSEEQFLQRTQGSAIRRIGWERWLRNIAVALGNALRQAPDQDAAQRVRSALQTRSDLESPLVREHIQWALTQQPVLE